MHDESLFPSPSEPVSRVVADPSASRDPRSADRLHRELDARARIAALLVRCCHAVDARDGAAVADLFLPDAEIAFDLADRPPAAVEALAQISVAGLAETAATRHVLGHGEIEVEGRRARSRAAVTVEHRRAGGRGVTVGGHYEDELVETPAGWRIARRRFRADWIGEGRLAAAPERGRPVLWLAGVS